MRKVRGGVSGRITQEQLEEIQALRAGDIAHWTKAIAKENRAGERRR